MSRVPSRSAHARARKVASSPAVAGFRPAILAVAATLAINAGVRAQSVPIGAVHGTATFDRSGNNLVVTTTNGAGHRSVINWSSFNVPGGSTTEFKQPDAASLSINRITGGSATDIFGTLKSNGRLVVVNPYGITVGATAIVDTAGFTASTLALSEEDAIAGRLLFKGGTNTLRVEEGATILAKGGDVVLVGSQVQVERKAVVEADGDVILAAGEKVEITGRGLEGIRMEMQAGNEAVNLGTLKGDAVGIFAGTLRHSGMIQAHAVTAAGGKVVLKAAGDNLVDGTIAAAAAGRKGGSIDVLGQRVGLLAGAKLDASGAKGGGSIRVGGDYQGGNSEVPNAQRTYVDAQASVRADAIEGGDGGRVIVWADEVTRMHGQISARGGAQGGNGGFAEVSGKQSLEFTGRADLRAPAGQSGTLLLDPNDIRIVQTGTTDTASTGADFSGGPALATITEGDLEGQLALGSVMVRTNVGTGGSGDITVEAGVTIDWSNANAFALQADRNIILNGSIRGTNASSALSLLAGTASPTAPGTVTQATTGSVVQVGNLLVNSRGNVDMQGANLVGTVSANTGNGNFRFNNARDLQIGAISTAYGASFDGINAGTGIVDVTASSATTASITLKPATAPSPASKIIGSAVRLDAKNNIALSGDIEATGQAYLRAQLGNITQVTANTVTSAQLLMSAGGNVTMNSANMVGTLAGSSGGGFSFRNAQSFDVVELTSPSAVVFTGVTGNSVSLVSSDDLNVEEAVTSGAGGVSLEAGRYLGVNAAVTSSGGPVALRGGTIDSEGAVYIGSTGSVSSGGGQIDIESLQSDVGGTSVLVEGVVDAGSGGINVTAQSIDITGAGQLRRNGAGDIQLVVDGLYISTASGNAVESTGGRVVLNPLTPTNPFGMAIIGSGGVDIDGAFNLHQADLSKISAKTLVVGNGGLSMNISLHGDVDLTANVQELSLISAWDISQSSGTLKVGGVNLDAGNVNVANAGNQVSMVSGRYDDSFNFASDTALAIGTVDNIAGVQRRPPGITPPPATLSITSQDTLTLEADVTGESVYLAGHAVRTGATPVQVRANGATASLWIDAHGADPNDLGNATLISDGQVGIGADGTTTLGNIQADTLSLLGGYTGAASTYQQKSGTSIQAGTVSAQISVAGSKVDLSSATNQIALVDNIAVAGDVTVVSASDLTFGYIEEANNVTLQGASIWADSEASIFATGNIELKGTSSASTIDLTGSWLSAGGNLALSNAGDAVVGGVDAGSMTVTLSGSLTQDMVSGLTISAPGGITFDVGGLIDLSATGDNALGYVSGSAAGSIYLRGVRGVAAAGLSSGADMTLTAETPSATPAPAPADLDLIGHVTAGGALTLSSPSNIYVQNTSYVSGTSLSLVAPLTTVYGKLKPGGAGGIGSATVTGDLLFANGGTMELDVASLTSFDTLDVSGIATTDASSFVTVKDLTGGTLSGTFGPTTLGTGSSLAFSLPTLWTVSTGQPYLISAVVAPPPPPPPPPPPAPAPVSEVLPPDEKEAVEEANNNVTTFLALFQQEAAQQEQEAKKNEIGKDDIVVTDTACTR